MHYTAYSLLTYDNMDSRQQTTMIWMDVGEQTMDKDDGGMIVLMPWDLINVVAPSKLKTKPR